ncbi:hypothetical protein G5B37_03520 [Rasiella rasia]|uniref:Uncharacterized protein n=1 Tax=Rasiella rasia TaxID=2744027 RepID=A0A6G6GLU1_9FLAO|nr:hypothetical protein [Rasiella rasia]QIE58661.1 hypothetical protein G5B37_03520 [Rasiella rasia]
MKIIKNTFLLILTFVISNCSAQLNYKDYYYPIGAKKQVNIYKYVDKNNPNNIEYWKVTTNPNSNKILTESYTTDFRLYNIFEEQLNENGAEVIRYADFNKSDDGKNIRIDGTIIDKNVYKWADDSKFKYSVKYSTPEYGNEKFIKERIKNRIENINVHGTDYSTLVFMDEYEIKSLDNDQTYEFYQLTYYAKGMGMVKYQRYHPDGTTIILELEKILTEKEFEKLGWKASR